MKPMLPHRSRRLTNIVVAALTFSVLALGSVLDISATDQVTIGGSPIGDLCLLHTLTGVRCPFCGMTRSFIETMNIDLGAAFHAHPAGMLMLVFFLLSGLLASLRAILGEPSLLSTAWYARWMRDVTIVTLFAGLVRPLWGG